MSGIGLPSATADEHALVAGLAGRVWRDLGVDPSAAVDRGVRTKRRVGARSCRHLPAEDRWVTRGAWALPAGAGAADDLVERAAAGARRRGWAVTTWRSSGSATRLVDAVAVADDAHLRLVVTGDGAATLVVRAGPAAAPTAAEPDPPYQRTGVDP